ncbi:unnamed protein product [Adineta steineri]|uniref:Uncharacterized protein n=1 Tax=Adineta steineri TaxID=433720 RepID=A0A815RIV0_9BILA|nr:unnamed protein product [Adineta steineri]CAF1637565.1 unnamed protein product [Adineta steineri]
MMMSFTSVNSSDVPSTILSNKNLDDYDYEGAAIYIAVILIWYSAGLVLMLYFRVRPRTFESRFLFDYETSGKSASSTTNPFAHPENRQRLWKIYYSSTEKENQPHSQYYQTITSDNITIGRINRKLADIHRMDARMDSINGDDLISSTVSYSSNENNRPDTTKFFSKKFNSRRSSGGSLNMRRPIFRVQSQPQTPPLNSTAQVDASNTKKQTVNSSRKPINNSLHRFTVERVPEIRKCSTVNENVS